MTLSTVTVTWNELDIGQAPLGGYVSFQLSAVEADSTDGLEIHPEPARTYFFTTATGTSDPLVASDNASLVPAGSYYAVTVAIKGQQPYTFKTNINFANGASQTLAYLYANQAQPVTQYAQYLPLPFGEPLAGYVPAVISDDSTATQWVPQTGGGGGGTVTTVSVATANGFAGTVATATTTPAVTVKTTVTGLLKGNGTAVSAASAGTDYVTPTGSGAALTGITAAQVGAASTGALAAEIARAEAAEALLAPLASPVLTGTPAAPTATALTDSTQLATTAYADSAVAVETSRAETAEALKLAKASNLSDLASASTARTNLGLGSAATHASTDFDAAGAAAAAQSAAEAASDPAGSASTAQANAEAYSSPSTTLGDTIYGGASGVPTRLAGNTTATRKFWRQTGNGSVSAAPAWDTLQSGDIPANAANTSGTAANVSGTPALPNGTTATTQTGGDNSTKIATTAFVEAALPSLPLSIANGGTGAATAPQNDVFAGPASGGAGVPAYRGLVAADLPTVPIAQGGTGQATQQAALDALAGAVTSGQVLRGNGTHVVMAAIQAGDVPTLNQSTSGNAATATNLAGGATLPDYLAPAVVALSFVGSGTTLVNAALGNAFNLTLTASTTTLGNPSNPVDGQVIRFRITQGSGGSFTLAYAGNYDFGAAGSPTLSTAATKVDILGFEYVSSISKWCYLGSGLGF